MTPKHKALKNMSRPTGHSSKRQLETESIPFLRKMANEEHKKNAPYIKKFGTFEERFKKYSKFMDKLK